MSSRAAGGAVPAAAHHLDGDRHDRLRVRRRLGGRPTSDHAPKLVTPADVTVEIRGGDNATRQINSIIPPGFACHRLVLVEVYTPGGSWSSYPPHKHDIHKADAAGNLLEADLEEIYYYKLDRPGGLRVPAHLHRPRVAAAPRRLPDRRGGAGAR